MSVFMFSTDLRACFSFFLICVFCPNPKGFTLYGKCSTAHTLTSVQASWAVDVCNTVSKTNNYSKTLNVCLESACGCTYRNKHRTLAYFYIYKIHILTKLFSYCLIDSAALMSE